jgi:hypothetical protein
VLAACAHGAADAPLGNHGASGPYRQVRAIDWQNRAYTLGELGEVTVKDGHADFALSDDDKVVAAGPGSGSYRVERPLFGDIDGDGVEDAVITGVVSTGGTGHFSDIRIYTVRAGNVVEIGGIPGGDRGDGGIAGVTLDGAVVVVERFQSADGDGACCPSQLQHERWTWDGTGFVEDVRSRTVSDNPDR